VSREDALQKLTLVGELIDPNPEGKATLSTNEIAEFQKILTDNNYTVRRLVSAVGAATPSPWFLILNVMVLRERTLLIKRSDKGKWVGRGM
jgi:hypothetical protein